MIALPRYYVHLPTSATKFARPFKAEILMASLSEIAYSIDNSAISADPSSVLPWTRHNLY